MTKLIITRTSEWNNKAREFGIYLNDKKIGVIADGEKKEFNIETGVYKINGKIDWCKSQEIEFDIAENESKEIEISGYKYGHLIIIISLTIMLVYFLARNVLDVDFKILIYPVAVGILYPMYYLTFGKNRYLRIREVK